MEDRNLGESIQRIELLKDENARLLTTLRTLCAASRHAGSVSPSVQELLDKVSVAVILEARMIGDRFTVPCQAKPSRI